MPGITGFISKKNVLSSSRYMRYKELTKDLSHKELLSTENMMIGAVSRSNEQKAISVASDDQFVAIIYGHCFYLRNHTQLDADSFVELYRKQNIGILNLLEGAFHIFVVDKKARELSIINDRLGALPLFWTNNDENFCFSYKPGFINRHGPSDIDHKGLITFLIAGYCLGSTTLLKNVNYLTPASILDINLKTLHLKKRKYWDLKYAPDNDSSANELANDLNDAILGSLELFLSNRAEHFGIFMSGGWDSKGLLGGALRLKYSPSVLITNGESMQMPYSDTYIAKRISDDFCIPLFFNPRNVTLSTQHCLDGIHKCELITDTCPEVFGQHLLSPDKFGNIDFVLKGDEIWGWQDYASNRKQAIGNVMPNAVSGTLLDLLQDDLSSDSLSIYESEIESVLGNYNAGSSWNDVKDYLYLNARVNRYIFGLGSSDEAHIQVRRPFLTKKTMDVLARIPEHLRVQKNLYKQLLRKKYPKMFSYGDCYTSSIPDYYYHMRPFIYESVMKHLTDGNALGGLLNITTCKRLLTSFDPKKTTKEFPGTRSRLMHKLNDHWAHLWHRSRFYRHCCAKTQPDVYTSDERLAFRVFLLYEYFCGSCRE